MRFSRDRRGQSVVVGTVILFGFLILALSLYQVQVVPQQNAQTEFEHFEEVRNDLVELRNGVLSAGQSEGPQFGDVKLGTSYRTRLFAINPPSPSGTLQTSQRYNITFNDSSGTKVNVSTRFIQYQSGYNELQEESIWYDNSVLYLDERDSDSRAVIIEDQNLVTEDGRLRITALQNEFRASGTRRVSLELYPANDTVRNLSELNGQVNVSIPTRLNAEDGYWNESIENRSSVTYLDTVDDADNEYESPADYNVSELRLRVDSPDNITVNSVGIQSEPLDRPVRDNIGPTEDGGTDGGDTPTGNGTASVFSTEWDDEDDFVTVPQGDSMPLNVTISNRTSGNLISNASIDYSIATNTSNAGTASLNKTNQSLHDGTDAVLFRSDSAKVGDEFEVYASAGDDVDVIRVQITSPGATMADRTTVTNAQTAGSGGSEVSFEVDNTGNSDIEIQAISIDSTSAASADVISAPGGNSELTFSGGGLLNSDIQIDSSQVSLDTNEIIATGGTSTGTFNRFTDQDASGNSGKVNMSGESVTITLYFTDGSLETYTLNI